MTNPANDPDPRPQLRTGRRTVVCSVGLAGGALAGASALAACGGDKSNGASDAGSPSSSGGSAAASEGPGQGVAAAKVPVGGGIIDTDLKAVVSQPTKGHFKAFSNVCTHEHCAITKINGTTVTCTCHGSEFNATDGTVVKGPATEPLPAKTATVRGNRIIVS